MPKAKPDQTIVHRIELQQSERDAMEAALAGRFVTNAVGAAGQVFTGIGNLLAPFGGALTAIAAAWLAEKGIGEILDAAAAAGERQKERNEESYYDSGNKYLSLVRAWLQTEYANGGWVAVCDRRKAIAFVLASSNPLDSTNFLPPMVRNRFTQFINLICDPNYAPMGVPVRDSGKTPAELWTDFYTVEEYGSDAYYDETNGTAAGGVWKTIFG